MALRSPIAAPRVARSSRRESIQAQKVDAGEAPIWTALAVVGFVVLIWGALIGWGITENANPNDSILTKMIRGSK